MSKIAGEINAEMMKNNKVIYHQRANLFAEMVGKTGSQQSVLDRLLVEIEQLRTDNERLKAELAEAKKDAERYRFIRDEENWVDDDPDYAIRPWETLGECSGKTFDSVLDSYIEAMKGK